MESSIDRIKILLPPARAILGSLYKMAAFSFFQVLKEASDVADLSPPAQFRTLSDNEDIDDDADDDDDTENIKGKKPFCRFVWIFISGLLLVVVLSFCSKSLYLRDF